MTPHRLEDLVHRFERLVLDRDDLALFSERDEATRDDPQLPQKLNPSGFSVAHEGHIATAPLQDGR